MRRLAELDVYQRGLLRQRLLLCPWFLPCHRVFRFVPLMVVLLVSFADLSLAEVPGIEVLQRETEEISDITYSVGWIVAPTERRERILVAGLPVERVQRNTSSQLRTTLSYNVNKRLALTGEWAPGVLVRRESWVAPGHEEERHRVSRSREWSVGVRYRFSPKGLFDPTLRLRTGGSGIGADLALSRIADPVVSALRVGYQRNSNATLDPSGADQLSVNVSVGLVANEKVTLLTGLGYRRPISGGTLGTSTLSLRWTWTIDPVDRRTIGVWTALEHTEGLPGLAFGVEWSGRLSRGDRAEKGVNPLETEE